VGKLRSMAEARFTCSLHDAKELRKILLPCSPRLRVTEPVRGWWRRFLSGEAVFVVTGEPAYIDRATAEVNDWEADLMNERAW
jgi:hypothetical protein